MATPQSNGPPVFGPPRPRPNIVLLSLEKQPWFDEMFKPLLGALKAGADIEEITDPAAARQAFARTPRPSAVLATDQGLTVSTRISLLHDARSYVRSSGGTLLFMGSFPSFTRPSDVKTLFDALGLPWESGDYYRTTFTVNLGMSHFSTAGLTPSYSQKALHLANVAIGDAVYLPSDSSRTQSMVFAPERVGDLTQTPAAFGQAGRGKVGYIGDVNAEAETTAVVLAMCGIVPST
ncbi:hypothetical protein LTR36_006010 [Oleoguttula mirabilis]|uniref:Uncharacterized protein n=1 Tax=Oleoguttula mirabilis TaxID=1507867 RepID=A0AAV9JEW1_9PEZI|nr:hypothetical protein LTR36_006010 [Oleoguttula mirabilis]